MTGHVRQRLACHGDDVVDHLVVDDLVEPAGQLHLGREPERPRRRHCDGLQLPHQADVPEQRRVHCGDRPADTGDRLVDGIDVAVDPLALGRVLGVSSQRLQADADGEQLLDDVVVQVARDPLPVLHHFHGLTVVAVPREFEGQRRLIGEACGHVDLGRGEWQLGDRPRRVQHAQNLAAADQWHGDHLTDVHIRLHRGEHRERTAPDDRFRRAQRATTQRLGRARQQPSDEVFEPGRAHLDHYVVVVESQCETAQVRAEQKCGVAHDECERLLVADVDQLTHHVVGGIEPPPA